MEQLITQLMLDNLPPESGPYLQWAAAHYDIVRPMTLLICGLWLLLMIMVVRWVWISLTQ